MDKSMNENLGFEREEDSYYQEDFLIEGRPYLDARKEIFLSKEQYAINYISDMIRSEYIDLSPEFQRNEVWSDITKKSLFIESLLLNIPIPIFYAYENEDGHLSIIDGKQRLSTIRDYLKGKFTLKNVKYLKEYIGLTYEQLPERVKLDFNRYQCQFYLLHYATPKRYLFDIFMRINTGSVPLTSQEIRNIFAKPKVRELLKKMSTNIAFLQSTNKKINDARMDAQEMMLRYIALLKNYDFKRGELTFKENSLSQLLENTIAQLNSEEEFSYYIKSLEKGCNRAYELFGDYAYKRVTLKKGTLSHSRVINKSLFAAITVLLTDDRYDYVSLGRYRSKVVNELAQCLDYAYGVNITSGTGNKKNIIALFAMIDSMFKECIPND